MSSSLCKAHHHQNTATAKKEELIITMVLSNIVSMPMKLENTIAASATKGRVQAAYFHSLTCVSVFFD
jgi:hypothetical protein